MDRRERERRYTFLIWPSHFCAPTLTFTVLAMRPADTTTALICRAAEAATLCTAFGAFILSVLDPIPAGEGNKTGSGGVRVAGGKLELLTFRVVRLKETWG